MTNRREALGMIACALAVAGVASNIPKALFDEKEIDDLMPMFLTEVDFQKDRQIVKYHQHWIGHEWDEPMRLYGGFIIRDGDSRIMSEGMAIDFLKKAWRTGARDLLRRGYVPRPKSVAASNIFYMSHGQ